MAVLPRRVMPVKVDPGTKRCGNPTALDVAQCVGEPFGQHLYRGFPYHRRGEEAPTASPITLYDVPIFFNRDGRVSVFMVREIINTAFRELNREFTTEEIDAIDTFRAAARRLQFETRLKPGETSFLNNYTVMHAGSEFDDWDEPEMKGLMLRLWLDVERKARPVVREIHIYENAGGRSGIDPQRGRLPAVAKYRAPDFEVRGQAATKMTDSGARAA